MYQIVSELLGRLSDDLRDLFEERAGIVEFEGMLPRQEAESYAMLDILHSHPFALTGVTVIQIDTEDDRCWVLATDRGAARLVARLARRAVYIDDPGEVVEKRFDGAALLCK